MRGLCSVLAVDVHVRSWQTAYRGRLLEGYLSGLRPEDRANHYTFEHPDPMQPATLVAVDRDAIIGFATTGPARGNDTYGVGELFALYVDPTR